MFPLAALFGGYYALYVAVLGFMVRVAIFLSCLVSADRIFNISKYVYFKCRTKLTGHRPEQDWNFPTFPTDPMGFPKVGAAGGDRATGGRTAEGGSFSAGGQGSA